MTTEITTGAHGQLNAAHRVVSRPANDPHHESPEAVAWRRACEAARLNHELAAMRQKVEHVEPWGRG